MKNENIMTNEAFAIEKARDAMKRSIKEFLNTNFPVIAWDCMIDMDSGMAAIMATDISIKHGYYVWLTDNNHDMEKKLIRVAQEILDRFQVNTHQDLLDLPRRMDGEALNAAKGTR